MLPRHLRHLLFQRHLGDELVDGFLWQLLVLVLQAVKTAARIKLRYESLTGPKGTRSQPTSKTTFPLARLVSMYRWASGA